MSSEAAPAVEPRLHRFATWFDPESAAVVTILLGLFQVLLAVLLAHAEKALPKFFILPLVIGIFIVAAGSFTMASERNPSRLLLRGCAYSNLLGLLGAVLALCLYCYSLITIPKDQCVTSLHQFGSSYNHHTYDCPMEYLATYNWSVTVLLLLYDSGAVLMLSLLSVSALKALKKD